MFRFFSAGPKAGTGRRARCIDAVCLAAAISAAGVMSGGRLSAQARLSVEDISPNTPNGAVTSRASTAGLTLAMAGDTHALYAVSLNAGVWASIDGKPWRPLDSSPRRANCISVDPLDRRHVVVGERNGRASPVCLNDSGIWESWDGGRTWRRTFDPLTLPGCESQSIAQVTFDCHGTLFAATCAGVIRRPRHARQFDCTHMPSSTGPATAVTASESKVWARTRTQLFVSVDDGVSWRDVPIPSRIGSQDYGFLSRGDAFSLAACDSAAVMVCKPAPDTTGNRNTLLIYHAGSNHWQVQELASGDGTGLGGRRFVKSFTLRDAALPPGIGGRIQLFYGGGQEVHQALGLNVDGTIRWDVPVQAQWGGPYSRSPQDIHPDIWDIEIPGDYAPPGRCTAWIACDGGVHRAVAPVPVPVRFTGSLRQMRWVSQNAGMHTQHIHTLTLVASGGSPPALVCATSDNDGWIHSGSWSRGGRWSHEAYLGDANWTDGDASNPAVALILRNTRLAVVSTFGRAPPSGAAVADGAPITIGPEGRRDGPLAVHVVQSTFTAQPCYPLLDVVMLADMPLSRPAPDAPGESRPPVLIRTTRFLADPSPAGFTTRDWRVEDDNLPANTLGFWVSGGHAAPTYYAYARDPHGPEQSTPSRLRLYKRTGAGKWAVIRLARIGGDEPELIDGGQYGPVFADPYDPDRLFVLTTLGVEYSADGGVTFRFESALTALIGLSGEYPLTAGALAGNARDVIISSRAATMETLEDVAFDPSSARVTVASPFTGVFTRAADAAPWQALTASLPRNCAPVASIAMHDSDLYVATEGRGVFRVRNYATGPEASYFAIVRAPNSVARLCSGAGHGIAHARVRVVVRSTVRVIVSRVVHTLADGSVPAIRIARGLRNSECLVCCLTYEGGAGIAGARSESVLDSLSVAPDSTAGD